MTETYTVQEAFNIAVNAFLLGATLVGIIWGICDYRAERKRIDEGQP